MTHFCTVKLPDIIINEGEGVGDSDNKKINKWVLWYLHYYPHISIYIVFSHMQDFKTYILSVKEGEIVLFANLQQKSSVNLVVVMDCRHIQL